MKKKLMLLAMSLTMAFTSLSYADKIENVVVSVGSDLSSAQREQMLDKFGADPDSKIVEVTNDEERKYLGSYVDESLIGTRAISCSYVEELDDGSGIEVETSNVTWVTPAMVKNALVTAGVKDAKVKVSAPFKVSGTAALTGVIKAFEAATGSEITEEEKQVANEEIAKTGELGQEIGKEEASSLIEEVKVRIVEEKIKDPEEIKRVVEEKAQELNITLNEEQFQKIVSLMENITALNLDVDGIKKQLSDISGKVSEAVSNSEETKGILREILEFLKSAFNSIFG